MRTFPTGEKQNAGVLDFYAGNPMSIVRANSVAVAVR